MIGPLSGVKSSTHVSIQDAKTSAGKPEQQQPGGTAGLPAHSETASPRGDSLEVSAAGLNEVTNSRPVVAVIETREEAAALLARIRQQFEDAGPQALGAQAGVQADQVSSLLKAAP